MRRTSSREKASRLHRSSSRRNKENGAKVRAVESSCKSRSTELSKTNKTVKVSIDQTADNKFLKNNDDISNDKDSNIAQNNDCQIGPQDCTEMDVQTFHVTLTYKPRI